jgi:uncharacterized protein YbjT (DUF2867 family)
MARITVLGGTGYAGGHIVAAAAARGHEVTSYSRNLPDSPVDGVDYRTGDLSDDGVIASAVDGADVVVSAVSPRGALEGTGILRGILAKAAAAATTAGARFGVIGGARVSSTPTSSPPSSRPRRWSSRPSSTTCA